VVEPYRPPAPDQRDLDERGEPSAAPPSRGEPGASAAHPGPAAPADPGDRSPWARPDESAPVYKPGYAPLPQPPAQPQYPPTTAMPADPTTVEPPAHQPGHPGQGYATPGHAGGYAPAEPYGTQPYAPPPGYGTPGHGTPPSYGSAPGHAPAANYDPRNHGAPNYGPPNYGPPNYGPPNYGPPNYGPPDHGPGPNYGPAPGLPPPRPPRKNNVPLIAVIVAVGLLLCAGGVTASVLAVRGITESAKKAVAPLIPTAQPTFPDLPGLPTGDPGLPTGIPGLPTGIPGLPTGIPGLPTGIPGLPGGGQGRPITVEYEVTGDGRAEILYTGALGQGAQRVRNAQLPWHMSVTIDSAAFVSVTAVRNSGDDGSITCRASVDGEEAASASRAGAFAAVSCSKLVYD
jgi:MmpS family membrane protein